MLQQIGIMRDLCPPSQAQRVFKSWDEKQAGNIRVFDNVHHRIKAVVAGAVRDENGFVVHYMHKSRWITARAHIGPAFGVGSRKRKEWRHGDELARILVKLRARFLHRQSFGAAENSAQICFCFSNLHGNLNYCDGRWYEPKPQSY